MRNHDVHWIDLARLEYEPHESPIRRASPLYNIYDNRSEGLATGFEEWMMHAGVFDMIDYELKFAAGFVQGDLCPDQDLLTVLRLEAESTVTAFEHRRATLRFLVFQGEIPVP